MGFTWSAEKEELFRFESDILVSASAGTGKTTALVELFVRLLDGATAYPAPVGPENILALTFSNKAAREMRERVAVATLDRLRSRRFDEVLQAATITTFHAFCASLLREYAFEAGLVPDFELLEEFDAARMRERAVVETLREGLVAQDPDVRLLLRSRRLETLRDELVRVLAVCYGADLEDVDIPQEEARLESELRLEYARYGALLDGLSARAPLKKEKANTNLALWRQHWDGLSGAGALPGVATPLHEGMRLFTKWRELHNGWTRWPNDIQPLRPDFKESREAAQALFLQAKALPDMAAVVHLARRAFMRLQETKRSLFQLDFEDLQREAIALLKARPAIREELQRRYHVILVDEFQDTNATQLELLQLVQRDPVTAERMGLPPARRLLVGDRKQSIYRFRGADVAVFRRMERELLSGRVKGRRLHFRENFRSGPRLIDFLNGLFPLVMGGGGAEDYDVGYEDSDNLISGLVKPAEGSGATPPGEPPPFPVEMILVGREEKISVGEARQIEAQAIAARIRALVGPGSPLSIRQRDGSSRPPRYGDVCLLLRRMTYVKYYERALAEQGIPSVVTQSSGLMDRPEVQDVNMLLRFLIQPLDPVARLSVLRSPACLLPDAALIPLMRLPEAAWLGDGFAPAPWRERIAQLDLDAPDAARLLHLVEVVADLRARMPLLPVSELLENLVERLGLLLVGDQMPEAGRIRANVEKLLGMVRDWERRTPGFDVALCVARLRDMADKEERQPEGAPPSDEQAVQIMTIHQAKGLEFPLVFLPDLANKHRAPGGSIFITGGNRIGTKFFAEDTQETFDTALSTRGKEVEGQKEAAEYQRLLYVALTRAKDYLVLSGETQPPPKNASAEASTYTWLEWIRYYLEGLPHLPMLHRVSDLDAARALGLRQGPDAEPSPAPVDELPAPDTLEPLRHEPEVLGTFSISMLNELDRCERGYYLRQVLDRSTLLWIEDEPEALPELGDNPSALNVGIWVHRYYEVRPSGEPPGEESWRRFLLERSVDPERPWARQAVSWIIRAGEFPDPSIVSTWRELPFLAQVRLPSGKAIRLKGMVDAIGEAPDGRLVLVDYKVASRASEAKTQGYIFQLRAYATVMAAATGLGFDRMEAYLAFLRDDEPWLAVSLEPAEMARFGAQLDTLVQRGERLRRGGLPPLPPEGCRVPGCRFEGFCLRKEGENGGRS